MNISDTKQFGVYLKERRKQLCYTQAFLSEVSGLSISFISDVENGKPTVELGKVLYHEAGTGNRGNTQSINIRGAAATQHP